MSDVRVGVLRWDGDMQATLGARAKAEIGAHWLAIDGRVVLDCAADDPLIGVSYEADGNGFGIVTVKLFCGSFATVDERRKPVGRLRRRLRRGKR